MFGYLFEQRTGLDVSPYEFAELATIPGVVGVKVSGQSADRVLDYVVAAPDARVYAGNDRAFADVVGGGGSGGGVRRRRGVFPAPWVTMAPVALRSGGRRRGSGGPNQSIDRVSDAFAGGNLDHLKAALAEFGLPGGPVRVALDGPNDAGLQRIRAVADLLT